MTNIKYRFFLSIFLFTIFVFCSSNDELQKEPNDQSSATGSNTDIGLQSNVDIHGDPETAKINILFVGNSLTYYNDLPKLVYDLGIAKGNSISTKMIAKPNYAIIDHLDNDNETKNEIKSQKYNYVVVQQGPSSQSVSRSLLFEGGRRFSELCNENNTKLAFFMVWPSRSNYHTFDGVIKNYTDVAQMYNAILCPVGKRWKAHFDSTGDFSYYGSDQFHPSLIGSKEAARIILIYLE